MGGSYVLRALFKRALVLTFATLICALGAPSDSPIAGRWAGRSPDLIGRSEEVELRFIAGDAGVTGTLHTPDGEITLEKIRLQGRSLTFEATRVFRTRREHYHYDGTLGNNTIEFTVQNDDGSSFFRFTVHRVE